MVTDIWLKRVENGAFQILGKLNSIEKKGSQRKNKLIEQNTLVWRGWCGFKIWNFKTRHKKYTSGFTENFCMSGCRRCWRQLCREKVKPKQDSLLAGSTDGGQRSSRRRCGNQLFFKPLISAPTRKWRIGFHGGGETTELWINTQILTKCDACSRTDAKIEWQCDVFSSACCELFSPRNKWRIDTSWTIFSPYSHPWKKLKLSVILFFSSKECA